jgi:hypothetical protein
MLKKYKLSFKNNWSNKKFKINLIPNLEIRKLNIGSDRLTIKETPGITLSWLGLGLDISGIPYYFKQSIKENK